MYSPYLRHMSMSVAIFSPKNGAYLEHTLKSGRNEHLLRHLRALRKICLAVEILHFEHFAAALCGCPLQLRTEHLSAAMFPHVLGEEMDRHVLN